MSPTSKTAITHPITKSRVSRRRQNSIHKSIQFNSTQRRRIASRRRHRYRTSTNGFDAFARPRRTTGHFDPFQCTINVFTRANVPRPKTNRSNPKQTFESSSDARISSTPPIPRATYRNPTTRSSIMTTGGRISSRRVSLVVVKCGFNFSS